MPGNLRKAWAALFALGKHSDGRAAIARAMKLCGGDNALNDEADVDVLAQWAQSAWDYMAMVRSVTVYRRAAFLQHVLMVVAVWAGGITGASLPAGQSPVALLRTLSLCCNTNACSYTIHFASRPLGHNACAEA